MPPTGLIEVLRAEITTLKNKTMEMEKECKYLYIFPLPLPTQNPIIIHYYAKEKKNLTTDI